MDDQAGTLLTEDPGLGQDLDLDLDGDLAEDELLVEEISIDGMCGVY